jgi:hypothetical protein
MPLTTNVLVNVAAKQTPTTPLDLGSSEANIVKKLAISLLSGVAAGQADLIFSDTRTLAASANEDLDLAGGLTGAFGATLTFVKVKLVLVAAAVGNTNNVIVGGAPSNAFATWAGAAAHTVTVRPGGALLLTVGPGDLNAYGVTAGTGDLLRIANSGAGTSVSYDVIVIGTSA